MDPLSHLLAFLKPRSVQTGKFDLASQQAVHFPEHGGIKCYAVLGGQCWLTLGSADPVLIQQGECFLLSRGWRFTLATGLEAEPVPVQELIQALYTGRRGLLEGDAACTLAGGQFLFDGQPMDLLLGMLPAIVHLHGETEKRGLRWSMETMRDELRNDALGGSFLVQQLAYMLLVQALRVHVTEAAQESVGWLYAMTDPQMKSAIVSMQQAPARPWTVEQLAQQAGMSRSVFAERFKERVGESPMEYLTRWRMLLAGQRLTESSEAVLTVALSLGYESESAFGKAFKRVMQCSPRQFSREAKARAASATPPRF